MGLDGGCMHIQYKPGIVIRYRRSKNNPRRNPSQVMTEALRLLSESEEMQPLISEANAQHRDVVMEVFHSRSGHPLLIHTALSPRRQTWFG